MNNNNNQKYIYQCWTLPEKKKKNIPNLQGEMNSFPEAPNQKYIYLELVPRGNQRFLLCIQFINITTPKL